MPFRSQAQRGFMYAKHPDIAKRFESETPKGSKLPYHVGGGSKPKKPMAAMFGGKKGY